MRRAWMAAVLVAMSAWSGAADDPAQGPPGLVLVLSGGGARGAAHIGVLKVMEELHVVPDMVVGTSMGSIVGGLYAAGWSPDEIEELLLTVDWNQLFSDAVPRRERSFRRKQDDVVRLMQGRLHFAGGKPFVPPGAVGGQRIQALFDSLERQSDAPADFDRMPIPYRAVAVDIATGAPVVIADGRLADAMRASMSIPGMFATVERDGAMLSDGGAAANLPVGIAKDLGAGRVVAVDITSPLSYTGKGGFINTFNQMSSLLTQSNRLSDLKRLSTDDVFIRPELGDISFLDFPRAKEAVALGEAAAREKLEELRALAATPERWAAFEARHRRPASAPVIRRVRLENSSPVNDTVVRAALPDRAGAPLDERAFGGDLMRLAGLDYFGIMRSRTEAGTDGTDLVLTVPPKPYSGHSLQLGLSLRGDFHGESSYAFAVKHQLLAANRLGGEWQTMAQVGQSQVLASEFYQPFGPGMRWFVAVGGEVRRENLPLWVDGEVLARYRLANDEGRVEAGRVLGNWGELRVGASTGRAAIHRDIGPGYLPDLEERRGHLVASFRVDTLDSTLFPRRGHSLELRYEHSSAGLGADTRYRRVEASAYKALTWGENTLTPALEYGENLEEVAAFPDLFFLGGLGRLSGLGDSELSNERLVLASVQIYRRVARLDLAGLRVRAFAGLSMEVGNVYAADEAITASSLRWSAGPFLGADTPLGPVFLGWGYAEGGRSRFYFMLGERF